MQFSTDYRLEDFVLGTTWEDLPAEVQLRARGCALDLLGALVLGSKGKQFEAGCKLAKLQLAGGDVAVVGSADTFGLLGAAAAMGHASNSFDIDDGHNMIKGHPGTSFIGGLIAAAWQEDVSFKEFLTTLVIGYDVAVRAGLALQDDYGFLHSTGTYGAVASAAVMGRLLGFDRQQLNNALAVADFHAPLTPVMRAVEYPSMSKDGVPFGAMVGALAVFETLCGTTGKTYTLEEEGQRHLLEDLGQNFEILNLYFKPYTCCRWGHQPIRACIDLQHEHGFGPADVKAVTVHTFKAATLLSKKVPVDTDEAQYNIAWPVASALVFGEVGFAQIYDGAMGNQDVIDMMGRLSFVMDPAMEAEFPEKRLAWVEIELNDGCVLKSSVYAAEGEATDGITNEWLAAKFKRVTAPILAAEDAQEIVDTVLEGDLSARMQDIVRLVNKALLD